MSAVLIVDDNPADRALFRTVLTRAGYTVHEASRGSEALTLAREVRPHAIVLDVNLPDLDGHAVCEALKSGPETGGFPVLMLTIRDNDADVLAGLRAGADDYVAKDAAPEIFLARVHRLIQFRQLATIAVLNEQLIQVGRLLAGIVHEIRGPLSVIRGSAELMRMQLRPEDAHHQWVDPILRSAQLLQVRLEHLMAAVRRGPKVIEELELAGLVHESAELFLKGTDPRGGRVTIENQVDDRLPRVRCDAGRLIQVLLSLFGNAHEALVGERRGGGRISIHGSTEQEEDREWVVLNVSDDGPGIPEHYLERIFEPFFTTKEGGSGYGLYLASEVLKEQQGRLTAQNRLEGGACFSIWLPSAGGSECS
jgi:signal transduction histidine kinase